MKLISKRSRYYNAALGGGRWSFQNSSGCQDRDRNGSNGGEVGPLYSADSQGRLGHQLKAARVVSLQPWVHRPLAALGLSAVVQSECPIGLGVFHSPNALRLLATRAPEWLKHPCFILRAPWSQAVFFQSAVLLQLIVPSVPRLVQSSSSTILGHSLDALSSCRFNGRQLNKNSRFSALLSDLTLRVYDKVILVWWCYILSFWFICSSTCVDLSLSLLSNNFPPNFHQQPTTEFPSGQVAGSILPGAVASALIRPAKA